MTDHPYEKIKQWKDQQIRQHLDNNHKLNLFHDSIMKQVFTVAIQQLNQGEPPCEFSWFITGSGGRFEQGIASDQDHGIVYKVANDTNDRFFLALGKEISHGLNAVGYPFCTGNIMSSNPLWCQSMDNWKQQLSVWMTENSWETIRYLQIFFDARNIAGSNLMIHQLKDLIFQYQKKNPDFIVRLAENIMHIKKGIGPFGHILAEEKGEHHGAINLKYTAFLPYVNSIRLLAMKEGLYETSTCDRIDRLMEIIPYNRLLQGIKEHFESLLQFRLLSVDKDFYEDSHYVSLQSLSDTQKRQLKNILKAGQKLHKRTIQLVKKGVYHGI